MSHEQPERERGRELELQRVISELRHTVHSDRESFSPEGRKVLDFIAQILSIQNSEYGTVLRIMDRQDEAIEARTKLIENLFGKNPGDEDCMASKVNQTYNALKSVKRVGMAVVLAMAVMMATKWYENVKLNEILAAQKVQAAKP